jgi:serine/threonine protein kinase
VIRRILNERPYQALAVLSDGNRDAALDLYREVEGLPSTTTMHEFEMVGWQMNGPLYPGSNLTICFRGLEVHLLKILDQEEAKRLVLFSEAVPPGSHSHIVKYVLSSSESDKWFMFMPKLQITLEHMLALPSKADALKLWKSLSGALQFIHDHNFVHCDVKPSNVRVLRFVCCLLFDSSPASPFRFA